MPGSDVRREVGVQRNVWAFVDLVTVHSTALLGKGRGFPQNSSLQRPGVPHLVRMAERALNSLNKADATLEVALRPAAFADFTGQAKVKERLEIAVEAALRRKAGLEP